GRRGAPSPPPPPAPGGPPLGPEVGAARAGGGAPPPRRQAGADEAAATSRPALVEGAWFHEGETRMDDQQHAFSALLYAADALEGRTQRGPGDRLAAVIDDHRAQR
ncbi:MAG: hypothetical protein OXC94_05005, partial [Chloroflexi bacterium]|nr:hypothetical protein [Chloroflexota bacterium]